MPTTAPRWAGSASAINTMLDRIQQAFGARLRSEQKVRAVRRGRLARAAHPADHHPRLRRAVPAGRARPGSAAGRHAPDRAGGPADEHAGGRTARAGPAGPHLLAGPGRDRPGRAWCGTRPPTRRRSSRTARSEAEAPARLIAMVDEARIRQVLANLLGNVREHTPPSTPVAVRLAPVRGGVVLEVADAGPGHVRAGRGPGLRPVPPRRGPGRRPGRTAASRPGAAAAWACPSCRPSRPRTAARPTSNRGPARAPGSASACPPRARAVTAGHASAGGAGRCSNR